MDDPQMDDLSVAGIVIASILITSLTIVAIWKFTPIVQRIWCFFITLFAIVIVVLFAVIYASYTGTLESETVTSKFVESAFSILERLRPHKLK